MSLWSGIRYKDVSWCSKSVDDFFCTRTNQNPSKCLCYSYLVSITIPCQVPGISSYKGPGNVFWKLIFSFRPAMATKAQLKSFIQREREQSARLLFPAWVTAGVVPFFCLLTQYDSPKSSQSLSRCFIIPLCRYWLHQVLSKRMNRMAFLFVSVSFSSRCRERVRTLILGREARRIPAPPIMCINLGGRQTIHPLPKPLSHQPPL